MEIPEHRHWMYIRKDPQQNRKLQEFILGVEEFILVASEPDVFKQEGRFRCPCSKCRWEPEHDEGIKKLWKAKAAELVCGSLADIRREKSSGKWLPKSVLEALKIKWEIDPNFLNMSEQNKKNIAANTDGCLNRGGAITISEHLRRLGHKLGRDATIPEVFLQLNYDPKTKKWLNPRAEEVYNKYEELKSSKLAEGVAKKDIDDSALFYEASRGKNNRGRSYGCGSEVAFFESSSSRYTRFKTTHSTDPAVQDLQSRLTAVESQLAELRGLVEKMDGAFPRHGGSSSGVTPPCDDENEINPIGDDIEDDDD